MDNKTLQNLTFFFFFLEIDRRISTFQKMNIFSLKMFSREIQEQLHALRLRHDLDEFFVHM